MADEFEFRNAEDTTVKAPYLKYELKDVIITSHGVTDAKHLDDFQVDETAPEFFDDFLF